MRNKLLTIQWSLLVVIFLFIGQSACGQLSDFSLTVTPANETCTGNGALEFSVSNTTSGASFFYSVYKLPDTVTPIAVVATTNITGLSFGNYLVVATQSLGALSNTQQQTVEILDQREPLQYQCEAQALNCLVGTITVAVAHGMPATYEIVSGPVTALPQNTNVFTNLPLGNYLVKVTDACGDALVQACSLVFEYRPDNLIIQNRLTAECQLINCNTKRIYLHISVPFGPGGVPVPNVIIPYPFELTLEINTGSGQPIFVNQTFTSGNLISQSLPVDIPYNEMSTYQIKAKITDPCGNVLANLTDPLGLTMRKILGLSKQSSSECLKEINISPCNTLPPYQITFLSSPAGFNPSIFNAGHPGPFNGDIAYLSDASHEIPDGNYLIQLTDACGSVLQGQLEVENSKTDFLKPEYGYFEGCDYRFPITMGLMEVPVQSVLITAAPAAYNQPLPSDVSFFIDKNGVFRMNFAIPGDYVLEGINVCGRPFRFEFEVPAPSVEFWATGVALNGCDHTRGVIRYGLVNQGNGAGPPMASAFITQAPALFNQPLPFDISDTILLDNDFPYAKTHAGILNFLPEGDYTIEVIDLCGTHYDPIQVNVPVNLSQAPPRLIVLEGCAPGFGSLKIELNFETATYLTQVVILSAPTTFNHALPYDVSFNIVSPYGEFYMNSLPEGTYTFKTKDSCGVEHTVTAEIGNHFYNTSVEVQGFCGSFNLFLRQDGPSFNSGPVFLLQRFNPTLSRWEHPFTGFPYDSNIYPNGQNSYLLSSNNYNLVAQGHFRVLKVNYIYSNGSTTLIPCLNVLKEFDFLGTLKITNAYKISCSSGTSQVLIVAGDTSPLTYEIIEKDGQPFNINNQNSSLFTGLSPAIYKFKVTDGCGNIVMRLFDVTVLSEPVIAASNLCEGQEGVLHVPPFSFLSYQWWKVENPDQILSTTDSLHFSPFSATQTLGTYYVRIYSESPLSCIDITLSYTIEDRTNPRAGEDNSMTICSRGAFDLELLRNGTFDNHGYWLETTNSGMLNGHFWLPLGLAAGTYTFKYVVPGFCDFFDEAVFEIVLIDALETPVISMNHQFCHGDDIELELQALPNIVYSWTGPNNFSSTEIHPQIGAVTTQNSGTYTVKAQAFGCEAQATVDIDVSPPLLLSLETICENNNQILFVKPFDNSFDSETVTYFWQGPEGYSSHEKQLILNDLIVGPYSVTVSNTEGCTGIQTIEILKTRCMIPAGVSPNDDGYNDIFDLTGFGVIKFKIFNRYGTMVFEQNDYTNQWHGQDYNNHQLPDATYFYYISLKSGEEKTGWVYVSR